MPSIRWTPIGRVLKTHGLKGEVSVAAAGGASFSLLEGVRIWFVPPSQGTRDAVVVSTRPHDSGELVTFDTVGDLTTAAQLVGTTMLVATDEVPASWIPDAEPETDLVGYRVSDEPHGALGEIVETIVTGANDVWVVEGDLGEILIPVIDQVVLSVNNDTRTVTVQLLPGLLEEE